MTKKLITPFLILFLILFGIGTVQAQTIEISNPGVLPDNLLYFFKTWFENVQTSLSFGDVAKAKRYADLAEIRLAEANALASKGKLDLAEKSIQRYQDMMIRAEAQMDIANAQGLNTTDIIEWLTAAYERHQAVLAEVYERMPEHAKPAIQRAMNNSQRTYEHAIEVLENFPSDITMPENYTETLKERHEQAKKRIEELRNRSIPVPTMPNITIGKQTIPSSAGQWLSVQASAQGNEIVVTVKAGGMPLSEVDIYINDGKVGVTDSNGQYVYRTSAPGRITVKAVKEGFLTASATVSVG